MHSAFALTRMFRQFQAKMNHELLRFLAERRRELSENRLMNFIKGVEPDRLDTPVGDSQ